jgi:hypothetical protein
MRCVRRTIRAASAWTSSSLGGGNAWTRSAVGDGFEHAVRITV